MVVAVRLERHSRSLHFTDLLPVQESFRTDRGSIDEKFSLATGFKKKRKGDFVVRRVSIIERQGDLQIPTLSCFSGIPQLAQEYDLATFPANESQMVPKLGGRDPIFSFVRRTRRCGQAPQPVINEHGCATQPEPTPD
jgi:hypothetical protein